MRWPYLTYWFHFRPVSISDKTSYHQRTCNGLLSFFLLTVRKKNTAADDPASRPCKEPVHQQQCNWPSCPRMRHFLSDTWFLTKIPVILFFSWCVYHTQHIDFIVGLYQYQIDILSPETCNVFFLIDSQKNTAADDLASRPCKEPVHQQQCNWPRCPRVNIAIKMSITRTQ